jgi:hypothetical protein
MRTPDLTHLTPDEGEALLRVALPLPASEAAAATRRIGTYLKNGLRDEAYRVWVLEREALVSTKVGAYLRVLFKEDIRVEE